MHVHVDEARRNDAPGGIENVFAFTRRKVLADFYDHASIQAQIAHCIDGARRIDDAPAADQHTRAAVH